VVIQFRADCFGDGFLRRPELAKMQNLLQRSQRGVQFTGSICEAVGDLMRRMLGMTGLERLIGLLNVFQKLECAAGHELSSRGFVPSLDDRAAGRVNQVYQWVFAHFTGPLDHDLIARRIGMSRSALCHYFKRVTGRTLTNFINEIRIGHARKLLIETDQTVAEIAYASGFESLSNFNRHFHGLTGVSPTGFRQLYSVEPKVGDLK
jgi:AraC-like DNA-binding protein